VVAIGLAGGFLSRSIHRHYLIQIAITTLIDIYPKSALAKQGRVDERIVAAYNRWIEWIRPGARLPDPTYHAQSGTSPLWNYCRTMRIRTAWRTRWSCSARPALWVTYKGGFSRTELGSRSIRPTAVLPRFRSARRLDDGADAAGQSCACAKDQGAMPANAQSENSCGKMARDAAVPPRSGHVREPSAASAGARRGARGVGSRPPRCWRASAIARQR